MPSAFRHVILTRFSPTDCLAVSFNFTLPSTVSPSRSCGPLSPFPLSHGPSFTFPALFSALSPALLRPLFPISALDRCLTVPLSPFPLFYGPFSLFPFSCVASFSFFALSRCLTAPLSPIPLSWVPFSSFPLFC